MEAWVKAILLVFFLQATSILAQNLREKIESISLWQDVTSQTIRELNQSVQQVPNDVSRVILV